jgi:uncharacterized OB-fold protein
MSTRTPYLPSPEGLNAEFYRQALGGTLHLQRCAACGLFRHPPRYYCAACASDAVEWRPSPGRGKLFSWTVTHAPFDRGWAGEIPYATGIIELEEGVRLVGALSGIALPKLAIGLPLATRLERMSDQFVFITLVPAEDGHGT